MAPIRADSHHRNRLLKELPDEEYGRLLPHLEHVTVAQKVVAYEPGKSIEHVFFPLTGVFSVVMFADKNRLIEIATVGNEGAVGIPVFLGVETTSATAFNQIPGEALRIRSPIFRKILKECPALGHLLNKYIQAVMMQIAQGVACNRIHSAEQRCARWLLMTHDRVEGNEFLLTQEFLGQMLGIRRTGVSEIQSVLQREGLIRYSRGHVEILNRRGLEKRACECYDVIRNETERIFQDHRKRGKNR